MPCYGCTSRHPFTQSHHNCHLSSPQLAEEAGEWMMEGASHGIAAVDCFELFGFPEDAPNLRDANSPGGW